MIHQSLKKYKIGLHVQSVGLILYCTRLVSLCAAIVSGVFLPKIYHSPSIPVALQQSYYHILFIIICYEVFVVLLIPVSVGTG